MFYFHPEDSGNDPIWRAYFSKGLKPPTRECVFSILPLVGDSVSSHSNHFYKPQPHQVSGALSKVVSFVETLRLKISFQPFGDFDSKDFWNKSMLNPLFQSHFLEDFPTWIADDRYQTKHDDPQAFTLLIPVLFFCKIPYYIIISYYYLMWK